MLESKLFFLQGRKPKLAQLTGGKDILTLHMFLSLIPYHKRLAHYFHHVLVVNNQGCFPITQLLLFFLFFCGEAHKKA